MNNNILFPFVISFLWIGFLHAFPSQLDSLSSSRYLKLPLDFYQSSSSFDMSYGVKDKWELGLDLSISSDEDENIRIEDQSDFISNYTFVEDEWVQSHDSISYTQKTIDTYSTIPTASITIDFKKFFFNKESENQSRNFYFFLSNDDLSRRKPSYDERRTFVTRSKTHEFIDIPDDPQDGDVYGEFYTSEVETIVDTIDKIENIKSTDFQLGLGITFDRKLRIFNIPDFFFCADIHLLQLSYSYSKIRSSGTQLNKYNSLIENYESIEEDSNYFISGPSLSLNLKYFF